MPESISRHKRLIGAVVVIVAIPALALAWWLLSPLLFDKEVQEEFPFAASAIVPVDMERADVEKTMAVLAKMDDAPTDEPMPEMANDGSAGTAVVVKAGEFKNADNFHKGSGRATILRGPDGSHVLRLEDFKVTNGPDLRVILSPSSRPTGRDDVSAPGYAELGKLKGNIGNQNYPIPDDVDVTAQGSVVIYCRPFHVVFSVAELSDGG